MASYQQAMLAICLAQFSSKRYRTGMRGVLSLAESSSTFAHLFQQELGLSIPDMVEMSRWGQTIFPWLSRPGWSLLGSVVCLRSAGRMRACCVSAWVSCEICPGCPFKLS